MAKTLRHGEPHVKIVFAKWRRRGKKTNQGAKGNSCRSACPPRATCPTSSSARRLLGQGSRISFLRAGRRGKQAAASNQKVSHQAADFFSAGRAAGKAGGSLKPESLAPSNCESERILFYSPGWIRTTNLQSMCLLR